MIWPDAPGQFGTRRKHDVHTGIDLYTYSGMPVIPCEPGVVVAIEDFTGPKAGSPWWNDTQAILVEGDSGVICYGELAVPRGLTVGMEVTLETCLGCVQKVLRKNKGRPMVMLHIELYKHGTRESVIWNLDAPKPENLLDPTEPLREAYNFTEGLKFEYE